MLTACRYLINGRVQGVGFRWFVLREAGRLGLEGYVRNLPDGTVEVVARGTQDTMEALEQVLARGPSAARVEGVEKQEVTHQTQLPNPFDMK